MSKQFKLLSSQITALTVLLSLSQRQAVWMSMQMKKIRHFRAVLCVARNPPIVIFMYFYVFVSVCIFCGCIFDFVCVPFFAFICIFCWCILSLYLYLFCDGRLERAVYCVARNPSATSCYEINLLFMAFLASDPIKAPM